MSRKGRIHSIQSLAALDGPGVRFAVFLQGCSLKCGCCHNPDTWEKVGGTEYTAEELIAKAVRYKEYFGNEGGITLSGGEPLLQADFVREVFALCHDEGIHTCLDTSGVTYRPGDTPYNRKLDELMTMTDLVMLDIKHIEPKRHKVLTGHDNAGILAFAKYLEEKQKPVWVRHVVVPQVTSSELYLEKLGTFIGSLTNVKALDVLPYHVLGKNKYEQLNMEYPLEGVPAATQQQALEAKQVILEAYRKAKQQRQ